MEIAKFLLIRYFSETWGYKLAEEGEGLLVFIDGENTVGIAYSFSDFYEESELYKLIGQLASMDYNKLYLAVAPDASPYLDAKYMKSLGIGLVIVDVSKGIEGVEIKIPAKARSRRQLPQIDLDKLKREITEELKKSILQEIYKEILNIKNDIINQIRNYINENKVGRETAVEQAESNLPDDLRGNQWIKILKSKRI